MKRKPRTEEPKRTTIRCAIYTRKSTEEGLEQEFNSLDAQREAGELFVRSQQHEGWTLNADRYDDGGFTGGNMERPALKRLMADIDAGRVDCVVVYKVDRLTGGSIVNQVQRAYNGLGQMTDEWQQVGAAVNTSTSPRVQYVWSSLDANNRSRLVAMVYPSGYSVDYNYATGLDGDISRLSSMSDSSGTLESYGYLGAGSMLVRTNGAGVVHTTTLDDLGRAASVSAVKGSTTLDGYGYTYDRNSNRLTRSNATNSAFNEVYTYDGTNQLTGFTRGLDSKDWGFDALGNRTSVIINGGTPDTWTANAQNQITGIGGATTPTYDYNGNMTGDETGKTLKYDAWNRLVEVKSGSTVLKVYTYDGGNRKITEDDGTTITQLVYSAAWQVLEEKVGSSYSNRYVWSAAYVDALVMRDDGTQRVWAIQDANWNVTALVDDSGNVLERFGYDDPYGKVTVYEASWAVKSGGSGYAWVITFQGMRYDETTGNFYQRNRWYSPALGRWITVDPMRFGAGDVNLYRFVGNNSANLIDPSGMKWMQMTVVGGRHDGKNLEFNYDFDEFLPSNVPPNTATDPVAELIAAHTKAAAALHKAFVAIDLLYKVKCKCKVLEQTRQAEFNKIEKLVNELFEHTNASLNCDGLYKIWDIVRDASSGINLNGERIHYRNGTLAGGLYGWTGVSGITFGGPFWTFPKTEDRAFGIIHEMFHKFSLLIGDPGYYTGGTHENSTYVKDGKPAVLSIKDKLRNADTYAHLVKAYI
jgi:RHS repeat-associated protein